MSLSLEQRIAALEAALEAERKAREKAERELSVIKPYADECLIWLPRVKETKALAERAADLEAALETERKAREKAEGMMKGDSNGL
jgi:hypothetical protein